MRCPNCDTPLELVSKTTPVARLTMPKKKVQVWRWAYQRPFSDVEITGNHYESKTELLAQGVSGPVTWVEKIDSTRKEVEVDDT